MLAKCPNCNATINTAVLEAIPHNFEPVQSQTHQVIDSRTPATRLQETGSALPTTNKSVEASGSVPLSDPNKSAAPESPVNPPVTTTPIEQGVK